VALGPRRAAPGPRRFAASRPLSMAETDGMAGCRKLAGQATHLFLRTAERPGGCDAFLQKRDPDFSIKPAALEGTSAGWTFPGDPGI